MAKGIERKTQNKVKIRNIILDQLANGKAGKPGVILKLMNKLDMAIDSTEYELEDGKKRIDVDALVKVVGAIVRLSGLGITTAAQEESIAKGVVLPGQGTPTIDFVSLLEAHLLARRQLIAQSMPTPHTVVQSIPTLSDYAKAELKNRMTPPPMPPPGGVGIENVGRPPTITPTTLPENISGTKQIDEQIQKLAREAPVFEEGDLDFGIDE